MDSPQQKAMIAEQKAYLDRRDDCGNDLKCILRAEKRRLDELNALRRKLEKPLPDAEMQRLTKGWKIGRESLYDRLVEGFSIYPLRQVTLADGRTVQWGFAPHAAMVQSVAVLGPDGHLQALAAANDLYRSQLPSTVKSVPEFRVFLPDAQRSSAVLGILRSWAVASSLGFSVDCAAKDRGACNKALVSLPPPTVYDLRCLQKRLVAACAVPGDGAKGSLQEVSLFWQ
ncbi:hypothetical protein MQE22_11750 [Acidithiobacillus sp. YTS05]|nr:hypothetical protein [Acidithiobacillus sp. CV18-3]MBU2758550.1 hypothetical protein [Acidithiobacillus sp. BN09-2]MBU2797887.1 hypothetical protein [Acidithiobacillus sp. VAN18-2]MBU2800599.1 hypothetical protein [Acidithiobacillus sp. VAN18-4]UTV80674.1 hypothetical protein MQE22_11750 [Acidithiobacillus sp. YTS05]